jgi:hypothetical protein
LVRWWWDELTFKAMGMFCSGRLARCCPVLQYPSQSALIRVDGNIWSSENAACWGDRNYPYSTPLRTKVQYNVNKTYEFIVSTEQHENKSERQLTRDATASQSSVPKFFIMCPLT